MRLKSLGIAFAAAISIGGFVLSTAADAASSRRGKSIKQLSHHSSGMASWYAQGARTASGARFNPNGLTAAHRTLPFGTKVLVRHRATGRTVQVTINDRGPFIRGRVIDLAKGAAQQLGIVGSGTAPVELRVVGR
jgi:rare lipoprotein A